MNKRKRNNIIVLVGCVLSLLIWKAYKPYDDDHTTQYVSNHHEVDKTEAYTTAQQFVTKKLKSPTTASFPWSPDEYTCYNKGDIWYVSSYVDAENSYGAHIRSTWMVEIQHTDDNHWKLKDIAVH